MVVICPKCGEKTVMKNNICEHCGCKIKQCSECGNILEADREICDYCGISCDSMQEIIDKNKEAYEKNLNECADKMILETERVNKYFRWASAILAIVAIIFLLVGFAKLIDFGNYQDKSLDELLESLLNVKEFTSQIRTFLIVGLIFFTISIFVAEYRTILSFPILSSKMDYLRFDYMTYYKNIKTYSVDKSGKIIEEKNGEGVILLTSNNKKDRGAVQLIEVARYRKDPSAKNSKIIKKSIALIAYVISFVFIYIGLNANIETYISTVVLESVDNFTFDFNIQLIIGVVCVFVADLLAAMLDSDLKDAMKWIREIKSKNNQNSISID